MPDYRINISDPSLVNQALDALGEDPLVFTPEEEDDLLVYSKDKKDIRHELIIEPISSPVSVSVLVVHNDDSRNLSHYIPCFKATPIGGFIYNAIDDSIVVQCIDSMHLGLIAVSYVASMRSVPNWDIRIPVPEQVIKRYLTPQQKRRLFQFKSSHKDYGDSVTYQYVQMLGAFS